MRLKHTFQVDHEYLGCMFGMEDLSSKGTSRPGLVGNEISGRSRGGGHYIQMVMDGGHFDESQRAGSTWGKTPLVLNIREHILALCAHAQALITRLTGPAFSTNAASFQVGQ